MDTITVIRQGEVIERFGFDNWLAMMKWAETLQPEILYDGMDCLYTDGDSGIVLIQGYSDIFPERGISIYPMSGSYCEFHGDDLIDIIKTLQARAELQYAEWEAQDNERLSHGI